MIYLYVINVGNDNKPMNESGFDDKLGKDPFGFKPIC